ncbi:MAG TPA: hypothetical protein VJT50_02565 [Pyrinomonadaceae bacterium]|nr:hypothetical protein [Pyrinomonadaceae bacterium]
MPNPFAGFRGLVVGLAIFVVNWVIAYLRLVRGNSFDFDAGAEAGEFEKRLANYIDIGKFILGLASGSIVLLIGSSALRKSETLPGAYASPLFLLALSIVYGIFLMVFLTTNYEAYKHKTSDYTSFKYSRNVALGYSTLFCFCVGYAWLTFIVTR